MFKACLEGLQLYKVCILCGNEVDLLKCTFDFCDNDLKCSF